MFRKFLVDTFDMEGPVLDVAGGKGVLGFELQNLNGVPCTIVDPRARYTLRKLEKKWSWGIYGRNKASGAHIPEFSQTFPWI